MKKMWLPCPYILDKVSMDPTADSMFWHQRHITFHMLMEGKEGLLNKAMAVGYLPLWCSIDPKLMEGGWFHELEIGADAKPEVLCSFVKHWNWHWDVQTLQKRHLLSEGNGSWVLGNWNEVSDFAWHYLAWLHDDHLPCITWHILGALSHLSVFDALLFSMRALTHWCTFDVFQWLRMEVGFE